MILLLTSGTGTECVKSKKRNKQAGEKGKTGTFPLFPYGKAKLKSGNEGGENKKNLVGKDCFKAREYRSSPASLCILIF